MNNINMIMSKLDKLIDILLRKDLITNEERRAILSQKNDPEHLLENHTIEYWKTEYNGIISEHKNMWKIYSGAIKLYLSILAAPIITTKLFMQINPENGASKILPEFWLTLIGIGLLGLVFTHSIIRYRLDIMLYARWLNGLRKFLKEKSPQISQCLDASEIPSLGPKKQKFFESPKRPIWVIVSFSGLANSYYIVAGIYQKFSLNAKGLIFVFFGILIHLVLYILSCRGSQVAGISK